MTGDPTRRPASGAAVLRADVTDAIAAAVLAELGERGYGRLSMEGVARRAGVGKSALYRRWPGRQEMVVAVLAAQGVPTTTPDTGTLRGDLEILLDEVIGYLTTSALAPLFPDLIAEAGRTPALAEAIGAMLGGPRRARVQQVFRRAIARGELRATLDLEMATDLGASAVYWRAVVRHAPLGPGYRDQLLTMVLAALRAL